jgi:hypothetical protein
MVSCSYCGDDAEIKISSASYAFPLSRKFAYVNFAHRRGKYNEIIFADLLGALSQALGSQKPSNIYEDSIMFFMHFTAERNHTKFPIEPYDWHYLHEKEKEINYRYPIDSMRIAYLKELYMKYSALKNYFNKIELLKNISKKE